MNQPDYVTTTPDYTPTPTLSAYSDDSTSALSSNIDSTFDFATTHPSASYRPLPPHIALPSPIQVHPPVIDTDHSRLGIGVIIPIIVGVLVLTLTSLGAIAYFCCRKRSPYTRAVKGGWQDIEGKEVIAVPKPHYEKAKRDTQWDIVPNYTEYVSRSEGRESLIAHSFAPTFGRIKEHHDEIDPFGNPPLAAPHRASSFSPWEASYKV